MWYYVCYCACRLSPLCHPQRCVSKVHNIWCICQRQHGKQHSTHIPIACISCWTCLARHSLSCAPPVRHQAVTLNVVLPPVPLCSKMQALNVSTLHLSGVLMKDAAALLSGASGTPCEDPGVLLSALVNASTTVICCFPPGSPPMLLLVPPVVEAGFRMLLVRSSVGQLACLPVLMGGPAVVLGASCRLICGRR